MAHLSSPAARPIFNAKVGDCRDNRANADHVAEPLHLIGRLVEPDEVGATVAYLCSDDASGLTGTDIAVDGGYTAIGPERNVDQVSKLTG